jgi:hypothetical protein
MSVLVLRGFSLLCTEMIATSTPYYCSFICWWRANHQMPAGLIVSCVLTSNIWLLHAEQVDWCITVMPMQWRPTSAPMSHILLPKLLISFHRCVAWLLQWLLLLWHWLWSCVCKSQCLPGSLCFLFCVSNYQHHIINAYCYWLFITVLPRIFQSL